MNPEQGVHQKHEWVWVLIVVIAGSSSRFFLDSSASGPFLSRFLRTFFFGSIINRTRFLFIIIIVIVLTLKDWLGWVFYWAFFITTLCFCFSFRFRFLRARLLITRRVIGVNRAGKNMSSTTCDKMWCWNIYSLAINVHDIFKIWNKHFMRCLWF